MTAKLNFDNFLKKAYLKHGKRYQYKKLSITHGRTTVLKILCNIHGWFEQKLGNHLNGHNCLKCSFEETSKKQSLSKEEFLERANKIHNGLYDYSKVMYKYLNQKDKIIIKCLRCNKSFLQAANKHILGQGCRKCNFSEGCKNFTLTQEEFIKRAKILHPQYDYSKIIYKNFLTKVCIICPLHGDFYCSPSNHISKLNKCGCPLCDKETKELRGIGYTKEYFKKYPNILGKIYLLILKNEKESFVKIGITKNSLKERFSHLNRYKYIIEKSFVFNCKLMDAWKTERKIIKHFKKFKYKPKMSFGGGETECFNFDKFGDIRCFLKGESSREIN